MEILSPELAPILEFRLRDNRESLLLLTADDRMRLCAFFAGFSRLNVIDALHHLHQIGVNTSYAHDQLAAAESQVTHGGHGSAIHCAPPPPSVVPSSAGKSHSDRRRRRSTISLFHLSLSVINSRDLARLTDG